MRIVWMFPVAVLAACSSSPYAPINESPVIRWMDHVFSGGRSDAYTPPAGVHPQRQEVVAPATNPD